MPGHYFVLDEPSPEKIAAKLLGRVVLAITSPLGTFAPREAVRNPLDIIPNLLPEPLLTTDRKDFIQNKISNSAGSGLTDFFGFNTAKTDDDKLTLESRLVKRYSLEQTKDVFTSLMSDEVYSEEVRRLLRENDVRKAYFVTGFITTEGSLWKRERKGGHDSGVNGELPLTSIATGPISRLDLGVKMSSSDNHVREQKFESKEPLVFAVAYDVVKMKRTFNKTVPGYFKDKVVLGPARYANRKYLTLGPDDEEIIEEEDPDEDSHQEGDVELEGALKLDGIDSEWFGMSFEIE